MPVMNNVAMARDQMKRRSDKNVTLALEELGELNTENERHQKLLKFVDEAHQRSIRNRAAGVEHLADQGLLGRRQWRFDVFGFELLRRKRDRQQGGEEHQQAAVGAQQCSTRWHSGQ